MSREPLKWASYATAAIAIVVATALRWSLDAALGDSSQYVIYYAAVMLTSAVGGTLPGLLTTAAGAAIGLWLFAPPQRHMIPVHAADVVRLLMFLAIGCFISILAGRLRSARQTARRAERDALAARELAESSQAAAEEANRSKDHFLATLSHELRNPLTPILAAVAMLQRERAPLLADDISEDLDIIRRNAELEARLIDDLLDLTRIARGKVELDKRIVDLCAVVHHAVEVCAPDIQARRLHFGVDPGPAAPYWIEADPTRLQQVFWNLLRNAIKFTPRGGCVGIRCRPDGDGRVLIEVNDSGKGIEPQALGRIFNAFEQAEQAITRQFGGLGLGLAISKSLVEMHGGTIEAQSEGRDKGSTFRVTLPLAQPLSTPRSAASPPAAAPLPSSQAPLRILLVEDHGDTARIISKLLQLEGHHVQTAGDVATAIESADHAHFDLVISDLGLPDRSGLELIRELRLHGHTEPAIALSGYGQEQDIRRSREAGFTSHVTKPVSFDTLAKAMAAAIEEKTGKAL